MVEPIVKRSAGLDVHKMTVMATILLEQEDGTLHEETREFGTFRRHRRELSAWLTENDIELVVMESTGIYWKSIYAAIEGAGLNAYVVNARHVKQVPGRKTDVKDSQWLASLARFGLLRPSFIPPKDLRELRLLTRYRMKLRDILAGEKNRLHKILDDGGIRFGGVVSDIDGVSARAVIEGLIEGQPVGELMKYVHGRMKGKIPELTESLEGSLSRRHLFLLRHMHDHIRYLEQELLEIDADILAAMSPYRQQWEILQTIPGIDKLGAAVLLVEIGVDMKRFGSMERLASWAGMCPGNNESAGKRKSGRTRKGSRIIRRILCEIANAARRTNSQFKGSYAGLVIRRGHKRTIVALGHKLLRVIYTLLNKMQPYRDPEIDYEALVVRKNAPRWIQALKKFGYWPQAKNAPAAA
jgi:transposase